jgi:hypothetical protein
LIWRRVEVPEDITLARLHSVIIAVMGWSGGHLHEFRYHDVVYAVPDPDFDTIDVIDERKTKLNQVIDEPKRQFSYIYDFGDDWRHRIYVEKISDSKPDAVYPICLGGKRNCPPEDCGGTWGYENFLEAINNPDHEEHEMMLDWIGGEFDPEYFDLKDTNEALAIEFNLKSVK